MGGAQAIKRFVGWPVAKTVRIVQLALPSSPFKQFIGKELASAIRVNPAKRMVLAARLWRHGFLSEAQYVYQFGKNRRDDYLPDLARLRSQRINAWCQDILNNKICFRAIVGAHTRTPINYGVLRSGTFFPLEDDRTSVSSDAVLGLCEAHQGLVCKPMDGACGRGIYMIRRDGPVTLVNEEQLDSDGLCALFKRLNGYLVTELVQQGDYSAALYPRTTNTLRILTMIDPDTHQPFIAAAVQRMGSTRSFPVDNWTQGGFSAAVDLESGVLGPGAAFPVNGHVMWHDHHPDSGAAINGVAVPRWVELREHILNLAQQVSLLQYVGWDIVLTNDGWCVIEGNSFSDVNLLQVHKPLLRDDRMKRFYAHHGLIKA